MKESSWARWVLALGYLALIHTATAKSPAAPPIPMPLGLDKLLHLCEFGLLAWLLWRPVREAAPGWPEMRAAAAVFAVTALNGAIDEVHQAFVPGRIASWADAAADALGGVLALAWCLHREKGRSTTSS